MTVSLAGCATVNVPNIGQEGYAIEADERRMHLRAEEMAEVIDDSGYIYSDEKLSDYVNRVAHQMIPSSLKEETIRIEVKILNDPTLNAFALPNGRIYIHTGMLAVIENEAQLAALLAHEMTHVFHRHALKQFRSILNKSAFVSTIQVPIAMVVGDLGSIFVQLATVSSIYGHSRELESEADRESFDTLLAQGYDVHEAPKLFEHIKQFIEDEDIKQPFFFSTHPHVVARIKNYEEFIQQQTIAQEGKINSEVYQDLGKPLVLKDVALCLHTGMFKTAERLLDKYIERYAEDMEGHFYSGELFRQRQDPLPKEKQRNKENDYLKSLEAYNKAIELSPYHAPSYRGKARVLQKLGRLDEAKDIFKKYLEIDPEAEDRPYVDKILSSQNNEGES